MIGLKKISLHKNSHFQKFPLYIDFKKFPTFFILNFILINASRFGNCYFHFQEKFKEKQKRIKLNFDKQIKLQSSA